MEWKQVFLFFKQEADEKRDVKLPRRWQLEGVYGQPHCHSHLTGFFSFSFSWDGLAAPTPGQKPLFRKTNWLFILSGRRYTGKDNESNEWLSWYEISPWMVFGVLAWKYTDLCLHQRAHCQLLNCSKRLLVNFCLKFIKMIFTLL